MSETPDRHHPSGPIGPGGRGGRGGRGGPDGPGRNGHPELPLDPDLPPSTPPHLTWSGVGLVFGGGVVGTMARFAVGELLPPWGAWPAATFSVNVVGALVLGVLLEALGRRGPDLGFRQRLRLLIGTGFLGAFTTYSALAVETSLLVREGYAPVALGYAAGSVVVGLLASVLGIWVAAAHHRVRRVGSAR
ncbi:MAG TPA: CrcB family protein [Lapillicoccus sp.]|nr:CrcB family protein [Lapillicoccus sp.]